MYVQQSREYISLRVPQLRITSVSPTQNNVRYWTTKNARCVFKKISKYGLASIVLSDAYAVLYLYTILSIEIFL